jgi:hypothetical protein
VRRQPRPVRPAGQEKAAVKLASSPMDKRKRVPPASRDAEAAARAINAKAWEPPPGMVRQKCSRCGYWFAAPVNSDEPRCPDCSQPSPAGSLSWPGLLDGSSSMRKMNLRAPGQKTSGGTPEVLPTIAMDKEARHAAMISAKLDVARRLADSVEKTDYARAVAAELTPAPAFDGMPCEEEVRGELGP